MSEHAPQQPESFRQQVETAEHLKALPTAEQAEPLRAGEVDPTQKLQEARTNVQEHAEADNPLQRHEAAEKAAQEPQAGPINRELKAITLRRELQNIQRQLPRAQRTLSRVVHQPAIRAVSEVSSKSISRPSGLLGGGILAFIGCSGYLYLAKHIGFSYNYFVFFLLFVAGFAFGLVLELAVWSMTAKYRHADA